MSAGAGGAVTVVPPHGDFSLRWSAPEGEEVLDLARAFAARVLDRERVAAAARAAIAAAAPAEGGAPPAALLQLAAAADILASVSAPRAVLRAMGAALAGLSGPPSPVRLRLDDLELAPGTTERSADVEAAAESPGAPYQEELEGAVEALARARRVRVWIEKDQQLPAAAWLCRRLSSRTAVEVGGPFLEVVPAIAERAKGWGAAAGAGRFSLEPACAGVPGLPLPEPIPWEDSIPLSRLPEAGPRKALVVSFCALDGEAVGPDGTAVDPRALEDASRRLRDRGARVIGEWWIGAPGIGEPRLEATFEQLQRRAVFDSVAGVRQFHWRRDRPPGAFAGVEVTLEDPPPERDLARSRPFRAPGTVETARLPGLLESLSRRLLGLGPLSPGRLAQAYLLEDEPAAKGSRVQLDPQAAIVSLPPRGAYACHLGSGQVLALDARVAPLFARLRQPGLPGEALAAIPEAPRQKLVSALLQRQILREVASP